MRRVFLLFLLMVLIITVNSQNVCASTGGNTGLTGLWEYPTAEMPEDGTGRFGYTNASPYGYYYIDLAWLPWLEINTRLSTFGSIMTAYGRRYMDKAIDIKAMLWHSKDPQKWIMPSIAFGVVDIMGTELMKAWYGAATWRYKNFALTLGYGSDRLNGLYGGFEIDIFDWLTFKAEYSPLDYNRDIVDGRRVIPDGKMPKKKYNAGIVLKAPWGTEGSISYQRGREWVFSISQRINLAGPYIGKNSKRYRTPSDTRIPEWNETNPQELIAKIKSGIEKYVRVRDIDIQFEETEQKNKIYLSYENYGYSSHAEAMTRVLIVLAAVMPETDELTLIHKNAGVPVVKATFPGTLLFDIRARTLRNEDSMRTAIFSWAGSHDIEVPDAENLLHNKATHEVKAMVTYDPRIDQTLEKAYMDRWNIDLIYKGRYYNGWGSILDIKFPLVNNIDTQNISGLWWEKDLNDKIRIQQAGLTYANRFSNNGRLWAFGEGGWLNEEWFGLNFWARYYAQDGKWWIGARASAFHDRDPYSFAGLTDGVYVYRTGHTRVLPTDKEWNLAGWIQAGYHITDYNLDVTASWGRFLDDDKGYKLELIRHWDDTAIGFYYINTDIHAPDKSMTRAGVHLEIPADKWFGTWFGNSSSHIWEQDVMFLSTWVMESGREGAAIRTPERLMNQLRPVAMKKNVWKLLEEYCAYDDGNENKKKHKEVTSILEYVFK